MMLHYRTFRAIDKSVCLFRNYLTKRTFAAAAENISDVYDEDADGSETTANSLYPDHIPTSFLQKSLLSVGSAAIAITAPWRGDMIATMGETTGYFALCYMRKRMVSDHVGQQILRDRPRINSETVDLDYLRSLPKDTFGRTYIQWLDDNRCHPDHRLPVHFVDDPELAYVMQRYREIHDLVHTLLGMPTHMLGEVAIKQVEGLQNRLPMCVSGALLGPLRLRPKHRALFRTTHMQWAARVGIQGSFLMNVYFEKEWTTPLQELRDRLNLEAPPDTPRKQWSKET